MTPPTLNMLNLFICSFPISMQCYFEVVTTLLTSRQCCRRFSEERLKIKFSYNFLDPIILCFISFINSYKVFLLNRRNGNPIKLTPGYFRRSVPGRKHGEVCTLFKFHQINRTAMKLIINIVHVVLLRERDQAETL